MIIDSLDNASRYESMNPYFKQVFDFIRATDWSAQEPGKTVIDGKNCFINYLSTTGKTVDAAKMETHRDYLDIQIPLNTVEQMGWIPTHKLSQPDAPYNEEKDITKYSDTAETMLSVHPGEFAIFWPWDGHQPAIAEGSLRKLVVKIKL